MLRHVTSYNGTELALVPRDAQNLHIEFESASLQIPLNAYLTAFLYAASGGGESFDSFSTSFFRLSGTGNIQSSSVMNGATNHIAQGNLKAFSKV